MCRIIRQVISKTHAYIVATVSKMFRYLPSKPNKFKLNCLLIEFITWIILYIVSLKMLIVSRVVYSHIVQLRKYFENNFTRISVYVPMTRVYSTATLSAHQTCTNRTLRVRELCRLRGREGEGVLTDSIRLPALGVGVCARASVVSCFEHVLSGVWQCHSACMYCLEQFPVFWAI